MKNLKIWSLALALLVAFTSCESGKESGEGGAAKLPFKPIAEAQLAEKLVGTYNLLNAELSGVYTFGTESVDWNNKYTVKIAENPLRLRLVEADGAYAEYKSVESVPAYVTDEAVEFEPTRAAEYFL